MTQSFDSFFQIVTRILFFTGKGGVGKTTLACATAIALAQKGKRVLLISTDPASNLDEVLETKLSGDPTPIGGIPHLSALNIDPEAAAAAYRERVVGPYRGVLPAAAIISMEEQLSGACTVEIAVFRAFANIVAEGETGFVVLDTAPTGHALLLLDAAEANHREVLRSMSGIPDPVKKLLPLLRDAEFTRIFLVTLPEATPVHEAARLQKDLLRAGITPYAWVVNQSFSASDCRDPILVERGVSERPYIKEVHDLHARQMAMVPWVATVPAGLKSLRELMRAG